MIFPRTISRQSLLCSCRSSSRLFSTSSAKRADFTHVIIGAGAVGLATARAVASQPNATTLLLERHPDPGTETSSRNSEVIHAGIYYGAGTFKTRLCVQGKEQLYDFCRKNNVPHRNTGKWIVAQNENGRAALERIHAFCRDEINVETGWVSKDEMQRLEPDVRAEAGCLNSPTTGIVDSHGLMLALLGQFEDRGGVTALNSAVTGVTPLGGEGGKVPGSGGWEITVRDGSTGEESTIETETLINCAGLGAVEINNMIVGEGSDRKQKLFYAKGNYFSYPHSHPKVQRLIYPAPEPGAGGLGTHLTLDMAGRIRFGPDVEWVDSPDDLAVNASRLPQAIGEIKKYLPGVDETALSPDYAGIRPKLGQQGAVMDGKGFVDFYIKKEHGYEGWINLLGIESPGLTSCLAIGDVVKELLYK